MPSDVACYDTLMRMVIWSLGSCFQRVMVGSWYCVYIALCCWVCTCWWCSICGIWSTSGTWYMVQGPIGMKIWVDCGSKIASRILPIVATTWYWCHIYKGYNCTHDGVLEENFTWMVDQWWWLFEYGVIHLCKWMVSLSAAEEVDIIITIYSFIHLRDLLWFGGQVRKWL